MKEILAVEFLSVYKRLLFLLTTRYYYQQNCIIQDTWFVEFPMTGLNHLPNCNQFVSINGYYTATTGTCWKSWKAGFFKILSGTPWKLYTFEDNAPGKAGKNYAVNNFGHWTLDALLFEVGGYESIVWKQWSSFSILAGDKLMERTQKYQYRKVRKLWQTITSE